MDPHTKQSQIGMNSAVAARVWNPKILKWNLLKTLKYGERQFSCRNLRHFATHISLGDLPLYLYIIQDRTD